MNQEIQALQDALQFKQGFLMFASALMALSRLLAKPLAGFVQNFFSKLLANYPAGAATIVSNRAYRLVAFLIDLVFSVKCPTPESILSQIKTEDGTAVFQSRHSSPVTRPTDGHVIVEWLLFAATIAAVIFLLIIATGCASGGTAPPACRVVRPEQHIPCCHQVKPIIYSTHEKN